MSEDFKQSYKKLIEGLIEERCHNYNSNPEVGAGLSLSS